LEYGFQPRTAHGGLETTLAGVVDSDHKARSLRPGLSCLQWLVATLALRQIEDLRIKRPDISSAVTTTMRNKRI
jgi:hypothetical protein